MVVLAVIDRLAFDLKLLDLRACLCSLGHFLRGRPTEVDAIDWVVGHLVPQFLNAKAKVVIVVVHEVVLPQKEPHGIHEIFSREEVATDDPVTVSGGLVIPAQVVQRANERHLAEQPQPIQETLERGRKVAGRRLQHAVSTNEPNSDDAGLAVLPHEIDGLLERVLQHKRVRIQHQDVLALGLLVGEVIRADETQIGRTANQGHFRKMLRNVVGRSVNGSVVDEKYFLRQRILGGTNCSEAFVAQLLDVVGNHNDGKVDFFAQGSRQKLRQIQLPEAANVVVLVLVEVAEALAMTVNLGEHIHHIVLGLKPEHGPRLLPGDLVVPEVL